jgi:hypothetical protein
MKVLTLLLFAIPVWCQNGQPVRVNDDPSSDAVTKVFILTGSNTTAICFAMSSVGNRADRQVSISAATNANPVVFTSTGHGFSISSRPAISIKGATGSWTPVNTANNKTVTATIIDANTFSIPVDSTAFGALTGTLTFGTSAPRTTVAEWAVQKIAYDGSNNPIWSGWVNGTTTYTQLCTDASSTTVVQQ